jgi:predicted Abi (CAAX) family protease
MAEIMHCYRHPNRETRVSCATCRRPICTECMRQTAVGIKCPDDARLPRAARAGVMKTDQIVKTLLAGVVVTLVGIPVAYVLLTFGWILTFLLAIAAGYGAGTLVYRAGGRNGGPLAVVVSVVATFVAFSIFIIPSLLAGAFAIGEVLPMIIACIAAGFAGRGGY